MGSDRAAVNRLVTSSDSTLDIRLHARFRYRVPPAGPEMLTKCLAGEVRRVPRTEERPLEDPRAKSYVPSNDHGHPGKPFWTYVSNISATSSAVMSGQRLALTKHEPEVGQVELHREHVNPCHFGEATCLFHQHRIRNHNAPGRIIVTVTPSARGHWKPGGSHSAPKGAVKGKGLLP